MIKAKGDALILNKAVQAMRKAVRNVISEHKLYKRPLIIWKDGRVIKLPASRLKRS